LRSAATGAVKVGILLDLRSYELATFYSDVRRGAFQMYSLRWIGGNEQPDIFSYAFSTGSFLRRELTGPLFDSRLDASSTMLPRVLTPSGDVQSMWKRSRFWLAICRPSPLVSEHIVVQNRRLTHVVPTPSGSYTFLETAELAN